LPKLRDALEVLRGHVLAAEALVAGYRLAFLVAAGIASLGVVAALYFFRQAKDFDT